MTKETWRPCIKLHLLSSLVAGDSLASVSHTLVSYYYLGHRVPARAKKAHHSLNVLSPYMTSLHTGVACLFNSLRTIDVLVYIY